MLTTRVLPSSEWDKLTGTELDGVRPFLTADNAQILAVESDGQLVGCWALLPIWHVEGVWIHPQHRKSPGVVRRLVTGMRWLAGVAGAPAVVTASNNDEITALLDKLGAVRLPAYPLFRWEMR